MGPQNMYFLKILKMESPDNGIFSLYAKEEKW